MEIAGLTVGGVALASLFSTGVECFEKVQLARHYSEDFELSTTQIDLLNARLHLWGRTVWVERNGRREVVQVWRDEWHNVGDAVGRSLVGISKLLGDVQLLKEKYAINTVDTTSQSVALAGPTAGTSRGFNEVHEMFNRTLIRRKKETSLVKKTAWAIHDRAKFGELITVLSGFLDGLEKVSDQLHVLSQQARAFEQGVAQVTSPEGVRLLEAAAQTEAPTNEQAAQAGPENRSHAQSSTRHTYFLPIARDRAMQVNSDVGFPQGSAGGPGNTYHRPQAYDDSLQINGSISGEDLLRLRGR